MSRVESDRQCLRSIENSTKNESFNECGTLVATLPFSIHCTQSRTIERPQARGTAMATNRDKSDARNDLAMVRGK